MVFSIYPWTLQLVRRLSVSNYIEQMRDLKKIFFIWPAVKQNLLVLFLVKKWWGSTNPRFTPELLIFPPAPNLFQTRSTQSRFSGKHLQPRPSGALSAVYFVNYKFQIVVRFFFLFLFFFVLLFPFKLCNRKVHLLLLGNRFKAKGRVGWVWRRPKVATEVWNQW